MNGSYGRLLAVLAASVFSAVMGVVIAVAGASSPPGSGVMPAALAFGAISGLGAMVMLALGDQENRIRELERQLRERRRPDA